MRRGENIVSSLKILSPTVDSFNLCSSGPQIVLMRKMFAPKPRPAVPQQTPSEPPTATEVTPADMVDYVSEHSNSDEDGSGSDEVDEHEPPNTSSSLRQLGEV